MSFEDMYGGKVKCCLTLVPLNLAGGLTVAVPNGVEIGSRVIR